MSDVAAARSLVAPAITGRDWRGGRGLVIEILSPRDAAMDLTDKIRKYVGGRRAS